MAEGDRPAYCWQCGEPIQEEDQFCGNCGAAILPPAPQAEQTIPQSVAASHAPSSGRSRTLALALGIGALAILLVGAGAFAAVAFQDRLGFLGGGDPQPPVASGDGSGGKEPTVTSRNSPEPTTMDEDAEATYPSGFTPSNPSPTSQSSPELTTTNEATESTENEAQEAAEDYYQAVESEDWDYTYDHLDLQTQSLFTREEWAKKNQWFADQGSVIFHIVSVNVEDTPEGRVAEMKLRLTYGDGSSSERTTYFFPTGENGEWMHSFGDEELDLYMPDASYKEFVAAQGGDPSDTEAAAVEDAIRGHYEAIGDGDFDEAYSYFGSTFRSNNDQDTWTSDEESFDIQSSTINSIEVEEVSGDTATATVDVSFEDNTGTPEFKITWGLVQEGGDWKLDEVINAEKVE